MTQPRRIVVTGAEGFIGRNLCARLTECDDVLLIPTTRQTAHESLAEALETADLVFHLAGVNRPENISEFVRDNVAFTQSLCALAVTAARPAPIVFASSVQATLRNPYGESKLKAEEIVAAYGHTTGAAVHILRLPNVFGKWARPNYNSVVATICHNAARRLPLPTGDANAPLRLVYIDDIVDALSSLIRSGPCSRIDIGPVYETTLGAVIDIVQRFVDGQASLLAPRAGTGLVRAMHATYLSYRTPESFVYNIPIHSDPRGEFVEMLKTQDSGQVSYFTVRPGATRGEHYHHSKAEKFLVVHGTARFGFRNVDTGETYEALVKGGQGQIVEIPPGWVHSVTNTGTEDVICILWANEVFDRARPDTYAAGVAPSRS